MIDYSGLLELSAIAFTLLFAFPNLFISLDDRSKDEWILNFYRFIAAKLLVPSIAYLSAAVLILFYVYAGLEILMTSALIVLIMTTFAFLCFTVFGVSYGFVKVVIERSVEKSVKAQKGHALKGSKNPKRV